MAIDIELAVAKMGREPINPIGQCFESAAHQIVFAPDTPRDAKLCHGIGIANMPGEEGETMGHAWIEIDVGLVRMAYDTTWGVRMEAREYRESCQLSYVREYAVPMVLTLWKLHNMPGPWDPKIRAVTELALQQRIR